MIAVTVTITIAAAAVPFVGTHARTGMSMAHDRQEPIAKVIHAITVPLNVGEPCTRVGPAQGGSPDV